MESKVYIYHGAGAQFSGAVFSTLELAETWISKNKLTGMLTAYPIDIGVFDWAVENKLFNPKKDRHNTPEFKGQFTSSSQEHYHYERMAA